MLRIRNYFIAFAVVFAISSAYALVGVQDAKAEEGAAYIDLIKRIEALESSGGGNVTAPKIRGLKLGFEIRHRFELRHDNAGNESNDTTDFTLQRTRIYLDADVNKNVRSYVKLQDVRTWGAEQSTAGNLARVDLIEGYVELRNLGDLTSILENVSVKIGRWQQWYGNHRLIGHLNWANEARSYDGLKLRWDDKKGNWVDAFFFSISEDSTGVVSGEGSGSIAAPSGALNRDELFWGLYTHFTPTKGIAAEPYLIIRNRSRDQRDVTSTTTLDGTVTVPAGGFVNGSTVALDSTTTTTANYGAGEQRYTAGIRIAGKKIPWLPGVDFTFEQAWQFGQIEAAGGRTSTDIRAFAGAWGAGYTFSNAPWSPRIGYDFVYASGDDNTGASGRNNTFSQLYPTGHARLGYIDFHGWQNIEDHQIHLSLKPTKKLLLKADLHFFSAAEDGDSWYNVGGGVAATAAPKFGGPATSFDDEYGDELDITMKYKLFKNFGIVAGYSHYFIDDAIENVVDRANGRTDKDSDTDWFYLQTTVKF